MDNIKLHQIKYAESTLPESWIFEGGDQNKKVPIIFSVFLIETKNKRILVDAGCETMPKFEMKDFKTPMAALQEQGIDPSDITDVIITHAHHDHIECVKYFPNAIIHIQQDEARRGQKYLTENPQVHPFEMHKTIEPNIKIVWIGGHSKGSCVVECKIGDKMYVLCGDECYSLFNIKNRVPTATNFSPEKSRAFIEKYTQDPYICLLCHDE